jgi:hypothetical protein
MGNQPDARSAREALIVEALCGVAVSNRDATARRWQPKQPARDTAKHLQANPPPRQRIKADLHQRQQLASLSRCERVLLVKLLKKIAPRSAAAQPC